ncbi:hypothetical protein KI387_018014, partial [Taxus chinensis]
KPSIILQEKLSVKRFGYVAYWKDLEYHRTNRPPCMLTTKVFSNLFAIQFFTREQSTLKFRFISYAN